MFEVITGHLRTFEGHFETPNSNLTQCPKNL